ncbi:hypothetical protein NDU88_004331 [Pleurodeles waltl]|uniref:Uncharacterized protein n=1 Tax=Pleurodeles waltl TaxID=8319 RepID=A0AAV7LL28_PLEWA|nr:hypothetical protein NDU88_004331 [Pleurodeles waltl]
MSIAPPSPSADLQQLSSAKTTNVHLQRSGRRPQGNPNQANSAPEATGAPPGPNQPAIRAPRPTGGAQGQAVQDRPPSARSQPPADQHHRREIQGAPRARCEPRTRAPQPSPDQHTKAVSPGTSKEGTHSRPVYAASPQEPRSSSQGPTR